MRVNDAAKIITSEMPSKSAGGCSTWNGGTQGERAGERERGDKGIRCILLSLALPLPRSLILFFSQRFTWNGRCLLNIFG
jgi:hypothetical protein